MERPGPPRGTALRKSAALKKRFLALILDFLTIVCYGAVLFGVNMFLYLVILDGVPAFAELGMNLISLTLIGPVFLYSVIMEAGGKHATLGKIKMKITVSSADSKPVGTGQIVLRNVVKFLPWQLAHMVIFHGFALNWELTPLWTAMLLAVDVLPLVWIGFLFRSDHRGLHDLIANTAVVDNGD